GDGLLRLGRGARRAPRRCLRRERCALLPGQLRHRLALPDRGIAPRGPRAQRRRRAGQLRRACRALWPRQLPARGPGARPGGQGLPRMTALPAGYELSDDPARIDASAAHAYLTRSYWSPGIPLETVERAIANS